ncbi:hypothetical protein HG530_004749 [Fusarium avenaceum]|nr:hypothetical protein HG530_004749 [Fusarium avenaceum]
MGLFSKALRRRRHRASPEVDLLSAAFGLPFRRGVMPADQKTFRRSQVIYETESDDSCESDSEETSSSSSEDDSGHQERGCRVSDRPPTPHSAPPASSSSSKKNSPRKRHHRRRRSNPSPHSSTRVLPRHQVPRSISRRSNIETMTNQQPVSYVRPSATFPPRFPIHLSKPPCNIVQSSTFPISPLNQSFGAPVYQPLPQQQIYYQNQVSYVPHQPSPLVQVHPPQFMAPVAQPVESRPPPLDSVKAPKSSVVSNNAQHPLGGGNAYRPAIAASKRSESSEVFGKEVQRLQRLIEAKMADLAEEPNSRVLRRDLRRLQDRLNSALNKAITASKKQHQRQSSLSTFSNISQSIYDQEIASSNVAASVHGDIEPASVCQDNQQTKPHDQRDESPQRITRHHFCSECGNIRSRDYHKRFPVHKLKQMKINLCESCRDDSYKRGVIKQYHFCFNCGSARSMNFHRQHPVLPGEPIITNYCEVCILELKKIGSLVEVSVVGPKYQNLGAHQAIPPACDSEEDLDSLTVNRHRSHKNRHGQVQSDQVGEVSPPKQVSDDEKPRGRRPEPRASRESVVPSGTGTVSRDSSYCPSRKTGSSERRAERKSSGHISTERSPHKKESKMPRNYQAPYVEDSFSTPHVEVQSPSPVTGRKEKDQKSGSRVCEPWKKLPPDFVLKSALASERSSSDGSRKSRDEAFKESPRPREKSLESDRSDPSSSKSSGSKTVRFKQSVDIRTSLPFDGDAEASASDPETPACLRSPGSPLISRKKCTFRSNSYDEGFSDKYLHPHYGQSSKKGLGAHREYLHTPDSFRAGTPAKGYSQGAFSKEFDHGEDWDAFRSPRYSHTDYYSDDNSFRGNYEADEEYQTSTPKTYDYGDHGNYMESTASLPSHLSSGSIFSSFFKKSKNKTSSAPPERFGPRSFTDNQTTPCPQQGGCPSDDYTSFTDPESYSCTDDGPAFEKTSRQGENNPYYTPRKQNFPEFSYCSSPDRSDGSVKREQGPPSPTKSDKFAWKNAFNPVPTVEEPNVVGDSSPEGAADLLEYNITDMVSSVDDENDEAPSSSSGDGHKNDEAPDRPSVRHVTGSHAA